jgi:hypothetical protein
MINLVPKSWYEHHKNINAKTNMLSNQFRFAAPIDFFWTDMGIIGGTTDTNGNEKPYGWYSEEIRAQRRELFNRN